MINILADSTCDLSKELVEKYNITILPLHVLLEDEEHEDGIDITPEELYKWSDEHDKTPKTSAPSIERAIECMKPLVEGDRELICFSISESMSTSGNVMRLAAEELNASDRVRVIDSANLSTGIGLLLIEAAIMAREGMSVEMIEERIRELIPRVRSSFVVDTMVYLRRGGRCSAITAVAGTVLKIHPEIIVSDGAMQVGKKYRGRIDRVFARYAKDLEPALLKARRDRVFITHSGCDAAVVEEIREYLRSLNHFEEILVTQAGSVVSSHCGPGTLGVLFIDS